MSDTLNPAATVVQPDLPVVREEEVVNREPPAVTPPPAPPVRPDYAGNNLDVTA